MNRPEIQAEDHSLEEVILGEEETIEQGTMPKTIYMIRLTWSMLITMSLLKIKGAAGMVAEISEHKTISIELALIQLIVMLKSQREIRRLIETNREIHKNTMNQKERI